LPWNSELDLLAAGNHGVFDISEALAVGVDRATIAREVRAGRLQRGLPGVYLMAGSPRTFRQRAHEVQRWAGPSGVLSFSTSASLLNLDVDGDTRIQVSTERNLRSPAPWVLVHRLRDPMEVRDVTVIGGLRVTTMPRTIIDLAAILDEEALDIGLDSAIRRGMWRSTFLDRFADVSDGRRAGTRLLRRLIAERETEQGLTGSAFERLLLRHIKKGGLPTPVCQHPFSADGFSAFIDFAYPEFGIAIEADGYRWHDGRVPFEKDRVRVSELGSWGWRVIQVTWIQLKYRPADVLRRLHRALHTPALSSLRV
jgi:predicted transcriptional regulator of viral defense system/very-short-patch-repair endonuclease